MFPDGKHIAVANHESNTITTFTVDYEKNVLVQKGRPMKVETPNCILTVSYTHLLVMNAGTCMLLYRPAKAGNALRTREKKAKYRM